MQPLRKGRLATRLATEAEPVGRADIAVCDRTGMQRDDDVQRLLGLASAGLCGVFSGCEKTADIPVG